MDIEEIIFRLESWAKLGRELESVCDTFTDLFGSYPDCKMLTPVFSIWEAYTSAVSEAVGDTDAWLDWYQYECQMGATPRIVEFPDGMTVNVASLRDLAHVIAL